MGTASGCSGTQAKRHAYDPRSDGLLQYALQTTTAQAFAGPWQASHWVLTC